MVSYSDDDINAIREEAGGSVRAIGEYDKEGYDVRYIREDVESKAHLAEKIHEELVIQGIGRSHLEQLFEAGRLHCSMHRFDEITVFHFINEEFTGLFVSIDSDADVPLATFSDTCHDALKDGD